MAKMDWERAAQRDLVKRQGTVRTATQPKKRKKRKSAKPAAAQLRKSPGKPPPPGVKTPFPLLATITANGHTKEVEVDEVGMRFVRWIG